MEPIAIILKALSFGLGVVGNKAAEDLYESLKGLIGRKLGGDSASKTAFEQYLKSPDVWERPFQAALLQAGVDKDEPIVTTARQLIVVVQGGDKAQMGLHQPVTVNESTGVGVSYGDNSPVHVSVIKGPNPQIEALKHQRAQYEASLDEMEKTFKVQKRNYEVQQQSHTDALPQAQVNRLLPPFIGVAVVVILAGIIKPILAIVVLFLSIGIIIYWWVNRPEEAPTFIKGAEQLQQLDSNIKQLRQDIAAIDAQISELHHHAMENDKQ